MIIIIIIMGRNDKKDGRETRKVEVMKSIKERVLRRKGYLTVFNSS